MTVPPCYDRVNHRDCPERDKCRQLGRSQCTRWVEYETAHRAELDARQKEARIKSSFYGKPRKKSHR